MAAINPFAPVPALVIDRLNSSSAATDTLLNTGIIPDVVLVFCPDKIVGLVVIIDTPFFRRSVVTDPLVLAVKSDSLMPTNVHAFGALKYALPAPDVSTVVMSDTASWCTVVNVYPVGPCTPTPVFVVPPIYEIDPLLID